MFNYVKNLKSFNHWKLTFSIFFVWKVLSESLFNWCWQNFKFLLKLTFYPDPRSKFDYLPDPHFSSSPNPNFIIYRILTSPALRIQIHQPDHHFSSSLNPDPSSASQPLKLTESGSINRILTSPGLWIRIQIPDPHFSSSLNPDPHFFRSLNPDPSTGSLLLQVSESGYIKQDPHFSSSLNPDPSTGSSLLQVSESGSINRILTFPGLWIRILTSAGL